MLSDVVNSTLLLEVGRGLCLCSAVSNMGTKVWICKPTGMNQGRGIFLLRNWEDITAFRLKLQHMENSQASRSALQRHAQPYIVQQYVINDQT